MRYVRELRANDPVRVTIRLVDYDVKRLHYFCELHHANEGWLSATSEQLGLHVDTKARRVTPFPDDVLDSPGADEGGARQPAAARRDRPQDRHAGQELGRLPNRRGDGRLADRQLRRLSSLGGTMSKLTLVLIAAVIAVAGTSTAQAQTKKGKGKDQATCCAWSRVTRHTQVLLARANRLALLLFAPA